MNDRVIATIVERLRPIKLAAEDYAGDPGDILALAAAAILAERIAALEEAAKAVCVFCWDGYEAARVTQDPNECKWRHDNSFEVVYCAAADIQALIAKARAAKIAAPRSRRRRMTPMYESYRSIGDGICLKSDGAGLRLRSQDFGLTLTMSQTTVENLLRFLRDHHFLPSAPSDTPKGDST
ncbi:MAG: hypothetical protein ACREEE_13450 [Dongiaceae bacterium]